MLFWSPDQLPLLYFYPGGGPLQLARAQACTFRSNLLVCTCAARAR